MFKVKQKNLINLFHFTNHFVYLLNSEGGQGKIDVSGGIERDQYHEVG